MTDPAALLEPDPHAERIARHAAVLRELTDIGMKLARRIEAVVETAADEDLDDLAKRYDRVARAVRRTIALEAKLAEDGHAKSERRRIVSEERYAATVTQRREARLVRRAEAGAIVSDALEDDRERYDDEDYKDIEEALCDWVENVLRNPPAVQPPLADAIIQLCDDIEIEPDWTRWANEPWANDAIRARAEARANGPP